MLDPTALDAAPDHLLAPYAGDRPPAPGWYEMLRGEQPEESRVTVDGAGIEVLAWGERGRPGILLVHGNRAHARWWGPVAPLLARDYRVASLSLSGTGGSEWREHYTSAQHAAELFAAIDAAGLAVGGRRPMVAAHSFGGIPAATAARLRGAELAGVAFVDSFIVPPAMRPNGPMPERASRHYPDLATALSRFRLSPSQPNDAPYILDDVARAGLVEEGGVWRWRFDPDLMQKLDMAEPWDLLAAPPCPIGFVYGERSALATPPIIAAQRAGAPPGTPSIGIPEAWHHVMFDQPLALVATLRALAACWFAAGYAE